MEIIIAAIILFYGPLATREFGSLVLRHRKLYRA